MEFGKKDLYLFATGDPSGVHPVYGNAAHPQHGALQISYAIGHRISATDTRKNAPRCDFRPPGHTFWQVVTKMTYTRTTSRYPGAIDMGGPGPSFSVILRPHLVPESN